jgi:hypothetical protein
MKVSAKPCSKASARKITLDDRQGCNKLFGGRWYGGESGAYLGYAGPRTDSGQRLWLRFRDDEAENTLSGFATGVTAKGPRGYGQKITLEIGAFGRDLQAIEFGSQVVKARSGLRCPDGGWRLRMRMETNADTGTDSARAPC